MKSYSSKSSLIFVSIFIIGFYFAINIPAINVRMATIGREIPKANVPILPLFACLFNNFIEIESFFNCCCCFNTITEHKLSDFLDLSALLL